MFCGMLASVRAGVPAFHSVSLDEPAKQAPTAHLVAYAISTVACRKSTLLNAASCTS